MGHRNLLLPCWIATQVGCFGTADAFLCTDDSQCDAARDGRCEEAGFCSYPDENCPSDRRYDDLANDELDGECVAEDPQPSTSDDTSSSTSDDASTSDDTSTGPDPSDTDPVEPCPVCVDEDGDGFGAGPDCAGADCDDANPLRADDCRYVAPNGDDASAGTARDSAWATLAHALAQLEPGDSLVLLPGDYAADTTGLLHAVCGDGGNATSGQSASPISIRSGSDPEDERQAILISDGSSAAIVVQACDHWRLHGLTARGADMADGASAVVEVRDATGVQARKLLVTSPNGLTNSAAINIAGTTDVLLEDSEVYDFHVNGVFVGGSERVTLRRVYVNSRAREDSEGTPAPSYIDETGDNALRITSGAGHRIENCVVVDTAYALYVDAEVDIAGTIALDVWGGILSRGATLSVRDLLVARSVNNGVDVRSPASAVLDGITVLDSQLDGVTSYEDAGLPCSDVDGCSIEIRNAISARNGDYGFRVTGPSTWSVRGANAFANATAYAADEPIADQQGNIRSSLEEVVPELGLAVDQCAAFVPEDSPMHARGVDGADIGANILFRIVDGERTDLLLWDPETAAFPCGALVAGINDEPTRSCFDVHRLVNVGSPGCELPMAPPACDDGS